MARDGAFSSRRGTGEGLLPAPPELILPRSTRAASLSSCTFQPNASANCGATQLTPNDRRGAGGAAASPVQHAAAHAAWKTELSIFAALNVDWPSGLREEAGSETCSLGLRLLVRGRSNSRRPEEQVCATCSVMNDREDFERGVRAALSCGRELTRHPSRAPRENAGSGPPSSLGRG